MVALAATWLRAAPVAGRPAVAAQISSAEHRILAAQPGHALVLAVGDDIRVLDVRRDGVSGGGLELSESPGHLRGRIGTESIELALATPRITGKLGDHRVSLDMLPASEGIRVAGRFGEREVALFMRLSGIDGEVGPCRYHLELRRSEYVGQVGCGGTPEDVRLAVPVALVARSDVEVAAMLVAVFAR
jgi:hypothetical protein